ncbi:MAG: hypothetical protein P8I54_00800 [Flavobacteriaceae bacterium]|nr:hypothetical protein [Flavobacteriaceae bacterium]
MKKLILLTTLLLAFACSKDDESGETFLDKYDGTSWRIDDSEILTLTDGTYFYNFVNTYDDVPYCNKLKEGVQTINGEQLEVTITKNEPDEMILEIKLGGVLVQRSSITGNDETLTDRATFFDEDGSSSDETYTYTKTNASYSDYCN